MHRDIYKDMNDTIKIKTRKEGKKMKKTILTTVLIMTVLFIFSTVSYSQDSSHSGWYNGMASVVEKEIRANEQNATAKENEKRAVVRSAEIVRAKKRRRPFR